MVSERSRPQARCGSRRAARSARLACGTCALPCARARGSCWAAILAAWLSVGCSAPPEVDAGPVPLTLATAPPAAVELPWSATEIALPQTARTVAAVEKPAGNHFAVATAHPLATRAATAVLGRGGTAVDALVAASFMLTVVAPQSTGIGGGGFAVVVPGDQRPARAVDFRETAPAATAVRDYLTAEGRLVPERSQHHGLAVAVPGYVAGLWRLHRRFGALPWAELVQPAVATAARGFPVGRDLARSLELVAPAMNPAARAQFLNDGQPLRPGEVLRQPALARTLAAIGAEGPTAFYSGAIADDIVQTVQAAGGKLSHADLLAYEVREFAPLVGHVGELDILTMPQPSAGGAQVLAMLEAIGQLSPEAHLATDPGALAHVFAEVMRRSFALRLAFSGDVARPAQSLDEAFPLAARLRLNQSLDLRRATPTARLPELGTGRAGENHANTSHVAVVDSTGMAVSATHTVNLYLGSGLATRGGVILNNEMDDFTFATADSNAFGLAGSAQNLARPGARPVSSMSPVIVLQHGQPRLVVGSPGGTRIPTTVLQVLARHLLLGQPLDAAVAAARVHHQAKPDVAVVETGAAADAVAATLKARGHSVERSPPWCNVQAVRRDCNASTCTWEAVSDPRAEGGAATR